MGTPRGVGRTNGTHKFTLGQSGIRSYHPLVIDSREKKLKRRAPHTRIDNRIYDYMPIIGTNGFAVYAVLKKHENRHTGRCYPSYQTVADITGLDRKTVIKYTNLLVTLGFIAKQAHFIEGRQTSNRYSFRDLPSGTIPPPQDRVESPDSPGGGDPPQPLSIQPALTKKQMKCPHQDIARPIDGVAYCRKCFVNVETLQKEVTTPAAEELYQTDR